VIWAPDGPARRKNLGNRSRKHLRDDKKQIGVAGLLPGGGQQGGQNDNRSTQQGGGSSPGKSSENVQSNDPNRKGGKI